MKSLVAGLAGLSLSACAPMPVDSTATPAPAIAGMDTVVSRIEARSPTCYMVRTLDGRAVCDTRPRRQRSSPSPQATAATHASPVASSPPPAYHAEAGLLPGQYLVIGSFSRLENALYWASFNADFGTEVQRVGDREPALYRVVIGPLEADMTLPMRAILSAVGAGNSWPLAVCGEPGLHERAGCVALPAANLADAAPL